MKSPKVENPTLFPPAENPFFLVPFLLSGILKPLVLHFSTSALQICISGAINPHLWLHCRFRYELFFCFSFFAPEIRWYHRFMVEIGLLFANFCKNRSSVVSIFPFLSFVLSHDWTLSFVMIIIHWNWRYVILLVCITNIEGPPISFCIWVSNFWVFMGFEVKDMQGALKVLADSIDDCTSSQLQCRSTTATSLDCRSNQRLQALMISLFTTMGMVYV